MHDEQTRCVAAVLERVWVEWNKTTRAMNSKGVVVVVYWTMEHTTWGCFVVCVWHGGGGTLVDWAWQRSLRRCWSGAEHNT